MSSEQGHCDVIINICCCSQWWMDQRSKWTSGLHRVFFFFLGGITFWQETEAINNVWEWMHGILLSYVRCMSALSPLFLSQGPTCLHDGHGTFSAPLCQCIQTEGRCLQPCRIQFFLCSILVHHHIIHFCIQHFPHVDCNVDNLMAKSYSNAMLTRGASDKDFKRQCYEFQ